MRALRWHGQGDVRLDDVDPPPPPGPGQVQLRVEWCGICGTDVEIWRHGSRGLPVADPHPITGAKAPLTLGHELSGTVELVGPGVESLVVGDPVAVDGLVFCGRCRECRNHRVNLCERRGQVGLACDGGLQPRVNVPAVTCLPLPAGLAAEGGAVAETLSVGVRALRQGRLAPQERVVVFGGGAVGLLALQAARAAGAAHLCVVDPVLARRRLALELGADEAISPEEAAGAPGDLAGDVVLECSGHERAVSGAIAAARSSGRIVLVGLGAAMPPLPTRDVVAQEKVIVGSLSHVWDEDFSGALRLLRSGEVAYEPLLTRIGLDDALDRGLKALAEHPDRQVKVLVRP
jgi:(R,R)-butanediol dehydrogenase/meso-butanediol dehydrogenase/diacetyl reductase